MHFLLNIASVKNPVPEGRGIRQRPSGTNRGFFSV